MELNFSGKKVLVIGGSSGIGNGIARAFLSHGAEVHTWGTRAEAADYDGLEGSDLDGLGYTCVDVSDPEAIKHAPMPFDGVDILIQSQGTALYGRREFEPEGWNQVLAVNLNSVLHCAMHFHEQLKAARGAMVVVSSISSIKATVGTPAYAASKAGVNMLVRTLAKSWVADGVRVNAFAPGLVDTKLTKITMSHPERRQRSLANVPAGRFGEVKDMAGVALFLASPLSQFIVGQTIVVDGGLTL